MAGLCGAGPYLGHDLGGFQSGRTGSGPAWISGALRAGCAVFVPGDRGEAVEAAPAAAAWWLCCLFPADDCAAVGDAPWGARPCAISNCGGVICSDAAVGEPDDPFAEGQGRAADRDARGDRRPGRDCAGDGRFLFGIPGSRRRRGAVGRGVNWRFFPYCPPRTQKRKPLVVAALLLAAAAPLLFLASMVLERGQAAEWNGRAIGAVAFLALATAAAYATYFWLLQQLEAYQLATVQWVQPLVAMAEAAVFLRLPLVVQHDRRDPGYFFVSGGGNACTLGG